MNVLSIFSGCGYPDFEFREIFKWRTIGYVEWDEYCQRVIRQRIDDGWLCEAPIFGDIEAFTDQYARRYQGLVDVVTAGFPCQPFSVAGKQRGPDDPRNMWPATIRVIQKVRPRFVLLENVPGIVSSGYIGTVLRDLAESVYDARGGCLSAAQLGADHKRNRLWVWAVRKRDVANPEGVGC